MSKLIVALLLISSISQAQSVKFNYKKDYLKYLAETKKQSSNLYFSKLKTRIISYDTTLTKDELLYLLIASTEIDSNIVEKLESDEYEIYESSENKNYNQTIGLSKKLLDDFPWNLTAHREISFALKSIGDTTSKEYLRHSHFSKEIAEAFLSTGNGNYETPIFSITFMDALQVMNGYFRCKPTTKQTFTEKHTKDVLYACQCYSGTYDQIFTKYFFLTHFKSYYGKFIERSDEPIEKINGYSIETINNQNFRGTVFTQFDSEAFLFEDSDDLKKYIIKNMKYPNNKYLGINDNTAEKRGYRITLKFIVTKTGELKDFRMVYNELDRNYADIAINFLKNTKKWNPAKINGKAVDSLTTITVPFYF
jgi:hypothetical protein